MRRFFLFAFIILAILAALIGGAGIALAEFGPFRPGSAFFHFQHYAEQKWAWSQPDQGSRALYALILAERRVEDLVALTGTQQEGLALGYLQEALDQATAVMSAASQDEAIRLAVRFLKLVKRVEASLAELQVAPGQSPQLLATIRAKVRTLAEMLGDDSPDVLKMASNRIAPPPASRLAMPAVLNAADPAESGVPPGIDPMAVAFPPGSAGAQHAFFPLEGKHAELACAACHTNGQYAGTPSQCSACHAEDKPVAHFEGECAACHSALSWEDVHFDHALAQARDCLGCHTTNRPANHYSGQCSACHSTQAWRPASFNHQAAGATDCQACHTRNRPANHFAGQCSSCHNTSAWMPASFNHQAVGAVDCLACHTQDRPANHFSGQCSACHNTHGWRPASFDHQLAGAVDCQSCHAAGRPANHYAGQCSSCHSTNAWQPASFDHAAAGATDCQACHEPNRPANHFGGQCSSCHNTNSWGEATFDHSGLADCQACHEPDRPANHFAGQCFGCHSPNAWQPASFNHAAAGTTDCQVCHTPPAGHWAGQCARCHNTSNWGEINLSGHSFPMDHGKAGGNCAACHLANNASVNCYTCHEQAETEKHHAEKDLLDIAGRCLVCHPNGDDD